MATRLIHHAYRAAQYVRLLYWRVVRPDVYGAKVVVIGLDQTVLLIRHSYARSDMYMLPGGGVRRGEDVMAAAAREVWEETGIVVDALSLHGRFLDMAKGARNHISVFAAHASGGVPCADGREIIEAAWFSLDALPTNISSASLKRILEIRDGRLPDSDVWP